MVPLVVVLCFPLLLTVGYGLLFVLSGRDRRLLVGPAGFALYLVLLAVPLVTVVACCPKLPGEVLTLYEGSGAWLLVGVLTGVGLLAMRMVLARLSRGITPSSGGGPRSSPVWIGPPGRAGFAVLMVPVAAIVLAEELVWRGFLVPAIGLPLSSTAFALHHYFFGWRQVVFTFVAALVWGGLFLAANELWPALASHLAYDVLAWLSLRRRSAASSKQSVGGSP
jgi:membrane protease YdiL (CAAX protease family)